MMIEILGEQNTSPADEYKNDQLAAKYKPSPVGQYSCLSRFDGTNCFQWFTSKAGGIWVPQGPVFVLVEDKA